MLVCLEQRTLQARPQRDIGKERKRRRRREEEGGCEIANEAGSSDGRTVVAVTSTAEVSGSNPLFLDLAMRFGVAWKESSEQ